MQEGEAIPMVSKTSKFGVWVVPTPERSEDVQPAHVSIHREASTRHTTMSSSSFFRKMQSMDFEVAQKLSNNERRETPRDRNTTGIDTALIYGEVPFDTLKTSRRKRKKLILVYQVHSQRIRNQEMLSMAFS